MALASSSVAAGEMTPPTGAESKTLSIDPARRRTLHILIDALLKIPMILEN
jgi:hypothetical protein